MFKLKINRSLRGGSLIYLYRILYQQCSKIKLENHQVLAGAYAVGFSIEAPLSGDVWPANMRGNAL